MASEMSAGQVEGLPRHSAGWGLLGLGKASLARETQVLSAIRLGTEPKHTTLQSTEQVPIQPGEADVVVTY